MPALESNVIQVLADFTAGDPSVPEVVWTYLTPEEISEELAMAGTPVGTDTVRRILDDFGFVQRKAQKYLAMGASPDRDAQFQRIAAHKAEYQASGNPILSMDAKRRSIWATISGRGGCTRPESCGLLTMTFTRLMTRS
jgi:hypothetical protein